jgi:ribosomal protein S1
MDDRTWETIKSKYKPGTFVQGKAIEHIHFGIFLDIGEPGVKGLIRIVDSEAIDWLMAKFQG